MSSRNFFLIVFGLVVVGLVVMMSILWDHLESNRGGSGTGAPRAVNGGIRGTIGFGGPFEMVNHEGKTVTEKDFFGTYPLIFFGYTVCPDVCPASLVIVSEVLEELGPLGDKITPVFVSVDPERDGVKEVADYVSLFHPRMVGLTGSVEQVAHIAKMYRIFYRKSQSEDMTEYLVDHTAFYYLMGPDGKPAVMFDHQVTLEQMATELRRILEKQ